MTNQLFDIYAIEPKSGYKWYDGIYAVDLEDAKALLKSWLEKRYVLSVPYYQAGWTYQIIDAKSKPSLVYSVTMPSATTELTPEGEQYVIPGCEKRATEANPQKGLFD